MSVVPSGALLGEHDKTLALLDQSARERDPLLLFYIQPDPAFDFLHADPRYRALVQRLAFPQLIDNPVHIPKSPAPLVITLLSRFLPVETCYCDALVALSRFETRGIFGSARGTSARFSLVPA